MISSGTELKGRTKKILDTSLGDKFKISLDSRLGGSNKDIFLFVPLHVLILLFPIPFTIPIAPKLR